MKPRRTTRLREPEALYLPDVFVVDCSVCLPWYIEDEASDFCDRLAGTLGRAEIWAPSLWRPELVSALINAERRKRMTGERRRAVLANADGLPLKSEAFMVFIGMLLSNYGHVHGHILHSAAEMCKRRGRRGAWREQRKPGVMPVLENAPFGRGLMAAIWRGSRVCTGGL